MIGQVAIRNRERVRAHRRANEQAILDATAALLNERPYRELAIEDVMSSAGLTRTAFYRYFPDLESVLLRLVEDIAEQLNTVTAGWLAADPTESRRALTDAGLGLAEIYQTHGRLLAAFADAATASPDVDEAWRAVIGGFVDVNTARITDLCTRGSCTLDHPEQTARALVWMTERYLLETYGRGGTISTVVAAESLAEIWDRAVFNRPCRGATPSKRVTRHP